MTVEMSDQLHISSNMARPRLNQLLVVLYLTVWAAAHETSYQHERSKRNHVLRDPPLSSTRCYQSPDRRIISCAELGLQDVPQDLFQGVEQLDLSINDIKFLFNSSFSNYSRINNLSLRSNDVKEIEAGSFYAMPMLQYLNLGDNWSLKSITSEMFKFSSKLSHLILDTTVLQSLPNDTLRWLPSLQLLDLSYSKFTYINFTSCSSEADKLNIVFYHSEIKAFTANTFRINCKLNFLSHQAFGYTLIDPSAISAIHTRSLSFPNFSLTQELWKQFFIGIASSEIEEIVLHDTKAEDIGQHYFELLRNKPLQVLDLSGNTFQNLTQMGFLELPLVSTLILDRCGISDIDAFTFARMKGLRILHLNFNDIINIGIDPKNYTWYLDLRELYLASNYIQEVQERTFKGLTNLTKLVLRDNKRLGYVMVTAFTDLMNLKYLDLSGCWLETVSLYTPNFETFVYSDCEAPRYPDEIKSIFNQTKSIKNVIMKNASLSVLWVPFMKNKTSLFEGMRYLRSLDVKQNPLKHLHSGLLTDLLFLKELDLSDCQLEEIEEEAFQGLRSLQTLYLHGNNLYNLPRGVFQNMGQLAIIHLDGNILKYLERDIFVNSSKLRNLTLAGNQFVGFNHSTFKPIFNTLISIDISANKLTCTCSLKWLPKWLGGSIKLLNGDDTRCSSASLEELREKPLMSFKPAELCGPNIALYVSLPLLVICSSVTLIVAYRHRWFLKYKLFLLKVFVIGYREIQDPRNLEDYEFHFNVMFAEEDEEWVRDRLRPVLEERLPEYNENVYGDNYLPLGMYYCDAVHYVVEMSYKTIILVSRAAIQDNWFVIKFRTAADQVNDTQIENMVVIFLEDIPDDELPFLVRLYLSDRKPYLSWEDDDDERFREYFWHKLIKMLTINLRCNNVIPPE